MIDPLPRQCATIPIVILSLLGSLLDVGAAEAPFGFVWSQAAESLPPPSSVIVDANIIAVTYEGPTIPAHMVNTEVVVLRVCNGLGLQQVRWISHSFSRSEAIEQFLNIYEEGVKRYGEADEGTLDSGTAAWSTAHTGMRMEHHEEDKYQILMISDGPQFARCQAEYKEITEHR